MKGCTWVCVGICTNPFPSPSAHVLQSLIYPYGPRLYSLCQSLFWPKTGLDFANDDKCWNTTPYLIHKFHTFLCKKGGKATPKDILYCRPHVFRCSDFLFFTKKILNWNALFQFWSEWLGKINGAFCNHSVVGTHTRGIASPLRMRHPSGGWETPSMPCSVLRETENTHSQCTQNKINIL